MARPTKASAKAVRIGPPDNGVAKAVLMNVSFLCAFTMARDWCSRRPFLLTDVFFCVHLYDGWGLVLTPPFLCLRKKSL